MDNKELKPFIEGLPNNIEAFKNKNPEEIVNKLNKLSQSEEGMETISELINQFKNKNQMFKIGGKLGLHLPILEKNNFKDIQNKFSTKKFDKGGKTFEEFKVIPADTTNNIVTQQILYRRTPESMQTEITRKYPINKPDESSYTKRMHSIKVGMDGTKKYDGNFTNDFFAKLLGQKAPEEMVSMFMKQYPESFK